LALQEPEDKVEFLAAAAAAAAWMALRGMEGVEELAETMAAAAAEVSRADHQDRELVRQEVLEAEEEEGELQIKRLAPMVLEGRADLERAEAARALLLFRLGLLRVELEDLEEEAGDP
jgi:hypothetical protein